MMYCKIYINDFTITAVSAGSIPLGDDHTLPFDTCVSTMIDVPVGTPISIDDLSLVDGVVFYKSVQLNEVDGADLSLYHWRQNCKVSNFQAKAALLEVGLLDSAEDAVSSLGGKVKLSWDLSPTWSRTSKEIISIGEALGLSDTDIDNLFKLAEVQ